MDLDRTIRAIARVRELAKRPFAFPGGYRIHFATRDGGALCAACVLGESAIHLGGPNDGWSLMEWPEFVHWEGPPMSCDHCGEEFPSEYGDPDAPEELRE